MAWSFDKHTPVYLQIAERIRNEIIVGNYPPASQVPSVRQLALTAAVNPNTVQHALTALEAEGLIYSEGTAGRFVTTDAELIASARHTAAKELVDEFLKQAASLSISRDELIKMIEEETT
ncbi:MAG: GntR family transcriptional regulator [Clostridia bacterium]|nr:GntR family transcriptional regulator [Clostridia bacterium]